MASAFEHLYGVADDPMKLATAYDAVLNDLFQKPLCKTGSTALQRVLWTDAWRAREEDRAAFESPGLYLWGANRRPVYSVSHAEHSIVVFPRTSEANGPNANSPKSFGPSL